jgi:hypothetical protein
VGRKEQLLSISKDMVADAYFSKHGFVTVLTANGFDVISRLRDDTDLLYLYTGVQKGGRGRPKVYDGKVCYDNLKDGSGQDNSVKLPFITSLIGKPKLNTSAPTLFTNLAVTL